MYTAKMLVEMQNLVKSLSSQIQKLTNISPATINHLSVKVNKKSVPLCDISSISMVKQSLVIKVADAQYLKFVENAIRSSNLGFNPVQKENSLVIPIPKPSADQRKTLEKQIKSFAEETKQAIRHVRAAQIKKIKAENKDDERHQKNDIQKMTDTHVSQVDSFVQKVLKDLGK